jgi:SAM-dependent methyltransferase
MSEKSPYINKGQRRGDSLLYDLIDPHTKENLTVKENILYSSTHTYKIVCGIPSFISDKEKTVGGGVGQFNELADSLLVVKNDNPLVGLYNKISCSQNRIKFIKKHLKKKVNAKILDIGCGGGRLAILYRKCASKLIGIDAALNSLANAKRTDFYDLLVHCSIENNPFPDSYFDLIVSTDVLGHTFLETKEKVYSEMWRMLKPEGIMIHAIETDSINFWIKTAKKNQELYKTNHIDKPCHIGMELPSTIIKRCKDIGFELLDVSKINAIIVPPDSIISWFDGEFDRPLWLNLLLNVSKIIAYNKYIKHLTNFTLGLIEKPINKVIPIDYTTGLLLCAKRPGGACVKQVSADQDC